MAGDKLAIEAKYVMLRPLGIAGFPEARPLQRLPVSLVMRMGNMKSRLGRYPG